MRVHRLAAAVLALCATPTFGQVRDHARQQEVDATECTVRGRVVDTAGRPLPEIGILVAPADALTETEAVLTRPTTTTDSAGRYEVRVTPPSVVLFGGKGLACARWTLAGREAAHTAPQPNSADGAMLLADVILPLATELRGRVRTAAGEPVRDAVVIAADMVGSRTPDWRGASTADVVYVSVTKSGTDGRFVLAGVFAEGLQLTLQAAGYLTQIQRPVDRSTPLSFELVASGVCRGRVVDAEGKPLVASLRAVFEAGDDHPTTESDADGAFELPLPHPGGYTVHAFVNHTLESADSGRLTGPTEDVTLSLRPSAPLGLLVRAVDADGQPVRAFDASVQWMATDNPFVQLLARILPNTAAIDGVAHLAKPAAGQPEQGHVLIRAKGFARQMTDVRWDPARPELEVKLAPESVVVGKVLDADGKPVAGAAVRVAKPAAKPPGLPAGFEIDFTAPWTGLGEGEVTTAADGTFRVDGLAEGEYEVSVWPLELPPIAPCKVSLAAGEEKTDLAITTARGVTLRGKLGGPRPGAPAFVTIRPARKASPFITTSSPSRTSGLRRVALGPDGTFAVSGLAAGRHDVAVELHAHPRALSPVLLPLGQVELRDEDVTREFELAAAHAILRGKVTVAGAAAPLERLLVMAVPDTRDGTVFRGPIQQWSSPSRAMLDRNGEFSLHVARGKYRLEVYDLLTSLKVGEPEDPVAAGGRDAPCEIGVTLGRVRVTLQQPEGEVLPVTRLELRLPLDPNDPMAQFFARRDYDTRVGLPVPFGQTTLEFPAPLGDLEIRARDQRLAIGLAGQGPLARAEVTVTKSKVAEVTLETAAPAGGK
ncbi:MAG: carboxypeptidase-like regulatory domain-containing protein [Planctomycetota bacterium]